MSARPQAPRVAKSESSKPRMSASRNWVESVPAAAQTKLSASAVAAVTRT